jgi:Fe-S cluster assembly protein SufD
MNAPLKLDLRDVSTFPTRRDEAWRYSDFRRAAPANIEVAPSIASPEPGGLFAALHGDELAFANGRTADGHADAALTLEGGVQRLRFVTDTHGGGWQAQVAVTVAAGAHAVLLETYEGEGGAYVASAHLRFVLEPGARLERLVLLAEPADAVSVSAAEVTLAAGASFAQTVVATGAKLQRHETNVLHPGQGASLRMDGVYLLGGARHADLTTVVAHAGPDGKTTQLTKGLATDAGRAVFQGRIVVERGADQTDARMRHDALLLSDRAEIDAKPELQINADDVSCAHGNTVGALDAAALFYIQSRGVPEAEAKALLTQAFVGEVLERIEHEGARNIVQTFVAERLEGLM